MDAIRIPANDSLLQDIEKLLTGPVRRLVKHARHYWLLLAESRMTRWRFARMLRRAAG